MLQEYLGYFLGLSWCVIVGIVFGEEFSWGDFMRDIDGVGRTPWDSLFKGFEMRLVLFEGVLGFSVDMILWGFLFLDALFAWG